MADWLIGFSTGCFAQRAFSESLNVIRHGGFDTVEVCSYRPHLDYHSDLEVQAAAASLKRFGFDAFSFHAPFGSHIDITALDDETRLGSQDELIKAAAAAHNLGVTHFVIHPGPEIEGHSPGEEHVERLNNAARSLSLVAAYCTSRKMMLVLENMLPHLMFGAVNDLLYLAPRITGGKVGVCLDTGHGFLARNLYGMVDLLGEMLTMVHANDSYGNRDDHLAPGKGRIDWELFVRKLHEQHFAGAMILEVSREHKTDEEIMREARESRAFLRILP